MLYPIYVSTAEESCNIDSVGVSLGVDFQPVGDLRLRLKNNEDNKNPLSYQRPASLPIQGTAHWYLFLKLFLFSFFYPSLSSFDASNFFVIK